LRLNCNSGNSLLQGRFVIELGSGSTGIPGTIALACGASHVLFCDIDEPAISELSSNIETNLACIEQSREALGIAPSKAHFSFWNDDWTLLSPPPLSSSSPSLLLLASEIVYDAVDVEPLVETIHRLLSACSGSMILSQSRHGRGKFDEFVALITSDLYGYTFTPLPFPTAEEDEGDEEGGGRAKEVSSSPLPSPLSDDFIFGIFQR
jgi:predicted nicotinamide N-methyase